ncbi:MAG: hypothetical protein AB8H12_05640 [Lewinella sp.]
MLRFLYYGCFAIAGIFFLLAAHKTPVKSLLQTPDGNYIIIENQVVQASQMLSKKDAATLVELEAKGFNRYKFIKRKVFKKAVNHTVTKHTKSKKKIIPTEIEELLAKYNPQDIGDGYFIADNRVVQKCQPLAKEDFQALQEIASRADAGGTISNGVFLVDYVDQTIVKLDESKEKISPAVLDRYAAVMKKYQR